MLAHTHTLFHYLISLVVKKVGSKGVSLPYALCWGTIHYVEAIFQGHPSVLEFMCRTLWRGMDHGAQAHWDQRQRGRAPQGATFQWEQSLLTCRLFSLLFYLLSPLCPFMSCLSSLSFLSVRSSGFCRQFSVHICAIGLKVCWPVQLSYIALHFVTNSIVLLSTFTVLLTV